MHRRSSSRAAAAAGAQTLEGVQGQALRAPLQEASMRGSGQSSGSRDGSRRCTLEGVRGQALRAPRQFASWWQQQGAGQQLQQVCTHWKE